MRGDLKTSTGLQSYDRARWTEWVPDISLVESADGLSSLYQTVRDEAVDINETIVPGPESTALLFWVRGQRVTARIAGEDHRLRPRRWDYSVLPPGCDTVWMSTPESANGVFHLHLETELLLRDGSGVDLSAICPVVVGDDEIIRRTSRWLFEELSQGKPSQLLWTTAASMLALRLCSSGTTSSGRTLSIGGLSSWQTRRVLEFLEAHLEQDTSLAALAALVDLSPNHFCTAFRQSLGDPPHRYLVRRRIERAQEMLADPRLSVTDVALALGFGSSAHFATAFRKEVGTSPSAYRRDRTT